MHCVPLFLASLMFDSLGRAVVGVQKGRAACRLCTCAAHAVVGAAVGAAKRGQPSSAPIASGSECSERAQR